MKVHTSQSARAHFRSISRALHSAGDHPQHTGDDSLLDSVLSVEEVGVYKSHPKVYQLAVDRPGIAASAIAFQVERLGRLRRLSLWHEGSLV